MKRHAWSLVFIFCFCGSVTAAVDDEVVAPDYWQCHPTGAEISAAFFPHQPREPLTPLYPRRALTRMIGGVAFLRFAIDEGGLPYDASVIESWPEGMFERSALSALKEATFGTSESEAATAVLHFDVGCEFRRSGDA